MKKQRLYFAYGANTHKDHMAHRCPAATPVGRIKLFGHRLAFRGVADVVRDPKGSVHGAVWEITPECEASLDRFESYPRLYVKRVVRAKVRGRVVDVMFYVMREKGERFSPPPRSYEATLRAGYTHFGIKHDQIDRAIAHAMKIDADPPFVSKWHRIDRDDDIASGRVSPPAKARAKVLKSSPRPPVEPVPSAWEQWRFDSFDERLRKARERALPAPEPRPLPNAPRGRLLAVPVGTTQDAFDFANVMRRIRGVA
jgi:gamma-glutamylcyclotransferase (GGCT)/AIG2-like uncharacterized protein YtfP